MANCLFAAAREWAKVAKKKRGRKKKWRNFFPVGHNFWFLGSCGWAEEVEEGAHTEKKKKNANGLF